MNLESDKEALRADLEKRGLLFHKATGKKRAAIHRAAYAFLIFIVGLNSLIYFLTHQWMLAVWTAVFTGYLCLRWLDRIQMDELMRLLDRATLLATQQNNVIVKQRAIINKLEGG